jgi:hypothetical protein
MTRRRRPDRFAALETPFAYRPIRMLMSPAYRQMSLSARRVLDRIEIEFAHHGGTNNGRLPVTYDDFASYGIHRHCIAPAIRELEALGFIQVTEVGRAGNAEWRRPNLFRLTHRSMDRNPVTNEWARIQNEEQAQDLARRARATSPRK